MSDLTILCVSRFGPHSRRFIAALDQLATDLGVPFVLGADVGINPAPEWVTETNAWVTYVRSGGYIESVLDEAVAMCSEGYILRMDDDETVSPAMRDWLAACRYHKADHWTFPRMHLWPDEQHYITNQPLYPDWQTRLSVKAKSGKRPVVHQPSPFGLGQIAEVPIMHHKFLVRDLAEREALLEHYERLSPGAGRNFEVFSVPEPYAAQLVTREVPA